MADSLYELLLPRLRSKNASTGPPLPDSDATDATTIQYLNRLSTLSLPSLTSTEPQSLAHSSHLTLLSLQALSNRSHKTFITSADNLSALRTSIPQLNRNARQLRDSIPKLDEEAVHFSSKYSKTEAENVALDRRKKAMQLERNADRLSDILELPALLSTAVSSAAANSSVAGASSSTTYSSALDLYAHIKRLQTLYLDSPLVKDVAAQAEDAMKDMTTNLISGLRAHSLRLAAAIRTVGWLRRVAPELETLRRDGVSGRGEGALGALFLVCRLANLVSTLEALDPLRELADQETRRRTSSVAHASPLSEGHQTEKFLKRYIEIYREQSFAIISLYKNIFSPDLSESELAIAGVRGFDSRDGISRTKPPLANRSGQEDSLQCLPSALATFPMHLVQLLTETLRTYLPNVQDKSSRESLLTQVLYCAASLGRLGGDFSLVLTELSDVDDSEDESVAYEWEEVMRKHRALAGRLEQLTVGDTGTSTTPGSKSPLRVSSPVH